MIHKTQDPESQRAWAGGDARRELNLEVSGTTPTTRPALTCPARKKLKEMLYGQKPGQSTIDKDIPFNPRQSMTEDNDKTADDVPNNNECP